MAHWSDKYLGLPYLPEQFDCASLAATVSKEIFNKEIGLPESHGDTYRGQSKQILRHRDDLAAKIEKPVDGCPALFYGRGRLCHIGVMCWIEGDWWVLHNDEGSRFVVRQQLRNMTRILYQLEGFYAWK